GDVKSGLARDAVGAAAKAGDDLPQVAVVYVHAAADVDAAGLDAELVAELQVVVQKRASQVVGGLHGVDVAGQVDVQVFRRNDLSKTAARSAALDAKHGPKRS